MVLGECGLTLWFHYRELYRPCHRFVSTHLCYLKLDSLGLQLLPLKSNSWKQWRKTVGEISCLEETEFRSQVPVDHGRNGSKKHLCLTVTRCANDTGLAIAQANRNMQVFQPLLNLTKMMTWYHERHRVSWWPISWSYFFFPTRNLHFWIFQLHCACKSLERAAALGEFLRTLLMQLASPKSHSMILSK